MINLRVQYRCSRGHYVMSTRRNLEDNRCTALFGEVVCDGTLGEGWIPVEVADEIDRLRAKNTELEVLLAHSGALLRSQPTKNKNRPQ